MSKRVVQSLKWQMVFATLLSLCVAAIVFLSVFLIGGTILNRTVYGRAFAETVVDQQFSKLQEYVKSENISLDNLQRLNAWFSRGEKMYLTIYKDDNLIYESPVYEKSRSTSIVHEFDPETENSNNEYILTLNGNQKVRSFLYYYAGDTFYYGMIVCSGVLAFFAFLICFIVLINRKISYISKLKRELDILSGGQLEYQVTISGQDELSELALGIDQMRRNIREHQDIENQIRSSNSELITAMSHDLRTPLTSLLAYLEILERKKYSSEEQMYTLIHKSVGQTMRIKNMADKLFEYFLAYATEWEYSELEIEDADQLFHQILDDYAYSLESNGMIVQKDISFVFEKVNINIGLLQRALDNIYSNLLKYAEPEKPIVFLYRKEDGKLLLTIENAIKSIPIKTESTSIGLITCRRIVNYHGGEFRIEESKTNFSVSIIIPLQK